MDDPLNPPWWHLRFWFYYRRAMLRARFEREEVCPHGCCVRFTFRGRETGGWGPVGVEHFEEAR